jgi:hypothetical protein
MLTTTIVALHEELKELEDQYIYVFADIECTGSDEWDFIYRIKYLPKEAHDLKRRATSFKEITSLQFSGGATYVGGYGTREGALLEGIRYAKTKLL